MAKVFDATLNQLIDARPQDWAAFLCPRVGIPPGPAVPLDTDLATTLQADRLFRIDGSSPGVMHIELEVTGRLGVPVELLRYNALTHAATGLPVHSLLVLLRPRANASDQTGELILNGSDGKPYLTFRYAVLRVWEEPIDAFLSAGVGVAPLAVLTNEAAADLGRAFQRLEERLQTEKLPINVVKSMLVSGASLGGLRFDGPAIQEALMKASTIDEIVRESSFIRMYLDQGRVEQTREILLELGGSKFGPATPETQTAVETITDLPRLRRMIRRVLDASGWDDLLATP